MEVRVQPPRRDIAQPERRRAQHHQPEHPTGDIRRGSRGSEPPLGIARQVCADQARLIRLLALARDVHVYPLAVQARPVGEARREKLVARWIEHDAHPKAVRVAVADADRKARQAAQVVAGTVDRVDDPQPLGVHRQDLVLRPLFAKEGVFGTRAEDHLANRVLDDH